MKMISFEDGTRFRVEQRIQGAYKRVGRLEKRVKKYKAASGRKIALKSVGILGGIASTGASVASANPVGIVFALASITKNTVQLSVEIRRLALEALKFGLELDKDVIWIVKHRWGQASEDEKRKRGQAALEVLRTLSETMLGHGGVTIKNCEGRVKQYRSKLEHVEIQAIHKGPALEQLLRDTEEVSRQIALFLQCTHPDAEVLRKDFEEANEKILGKVEDLLDSMSTKMQWARFGLNPRGFKSGSRTVKAEIEALKAHRRSLWDNLFMGGKDMPKKQAKKLEKQIRNDQLPPNVGDIETMIEEMKKNVPNWTKVLNDYVVPLVAFASIAGDATALHTAVVDHATDIIDKQVGLADASVTSFAKYTSTTLEALHEKCRTPEWASEAAEWDSEIGEAIAKITDFVGGFSG